MDEEFELEDAIDKSVRTGMAVFVEWTESIEYMIGLLEDIGLCDYCFYPLGPHCSLMFVESDDFRLVVRLSK